MFFEVQHIITVTTSDAENQKTRHKLLKWCECKEYITYDLNKASGILFMFTFVIDSCCFCSSVLLFLQGVDLPKRAFLQSSLLQKPERTEAFSFPAPSIFLPESSPLCAFWKKMLHAPRGLVFKSYVNGIVYICKNWLLILSMKDQPDD